MRKFVFAFGALFALSFVSCVGCSEADTSEQDTIVPIDTTEQPLEVKGVAIDGAMNSISLLVGDDTVYFSYPDLDNDHRASWDINDSVTIRYYATENGDSVTEVINEADA